MPEYIQIDGSSGFQWNSNNNFKTSINTRGLDNVIDIVFIDRKGRAVSVDLQKFKDKINNTSIDSTDVSFVPRCNDDAKEPVSIRETGRDNFRNNFTLTSGSWHANDDGEDDEVSNWDHEFRNNFQFEALKQADPNWKDTDGKCTEFSLLYHRLDIIQQMFHRGYRFFDMNNLNSWKNWIGYPSSGGTYYVYTMIMCLTAEDYAKVLGCFNGQRNDMETTVHRLFTANGLTNRDNMKNMGNAFCSNPIPDYSYLGTGSYKMGTTIWSPNTKYKLFVQPDGNMVLYEQQNANTDYPSACRSYWSTDSGKFYGNEISVRPILAVQADGNIVLYKQKSTEARKLTLGGSIWNTNTRGSGVKLGLANNGHLFAFTGHPQTNNLNVIWSTQKTEEVHNEIVKNFYAFNGKCTDTNYTSSTVNNLKYRYEYCSQGDKPYSDSNCKNLFAGYTISGDSNDTYKKKMDDTVVDLCKGVSSSSSQAYKDFCSCVNPLGDAKTIYETGKFHPKCWENKCINSGYKLNSYATNTCPSKICIQDIKLTNVIQEAGSKVEMKCEIDGDKTVKRDVVNTPNTLCGSLKIRGKCLNTNTSNNVNIHDCLDNMHVNSKYQKFQYNPAKMQLKTAWSNASPKCLTIKGGVISNNTDIHLANCDNSESQQFLYDKNRNQIVSNKDQTKCVDLKAGDYTSGTGFQLRTCEDGIEGQIFSSTECSETALQDLLYSTNLTIEDRNLCGNATLNTDTNKCINFSKDGIYVEDCPITTNFKNNTKVFSLNAVDSSIRDYHTGENCLEDGGDGKVYMRQCEDVRQIYATGTAGTLPARQKFLYNTTTKQLHSGSNNKKCVESKLNNGVYSLVISDCSDSNGSQKFNLGAFCNDQQKNTIATSETTRLRLLENARLAEANRLAQEAEAKRLAEQQRLKAISDEAERLRLIEEQRLKAIADEEARLLAVEKERVRLLKEKELAELAEKIRLEELAEQARLEEAERQRIEQEQQLALVLAQDAERKRLIEEAELAKQAALEAEQKIIEEENQRTYIIIFVILFVCIIITIVVSRLNNTKKGYGEKWDLLRVKQKQ